MEKFIPFCKLSKKMQKQINSQKRSTWNGFNPITRKTKNAKIYNRKKSHQNDYFNSDEIFIYNIYCFKSEFSIA